MKAAFVFLILAWIVFFALFFAPIVGAQFGFESVPDVLNVGWKIGGGGASSG